MKKTLLAAALLAGFAGAASAQSSVTLYGIVDAGLQYTNFSYSNSAASTSSLGVKSGGQSGSRFGLKGVEDLGEAVGSYKDIDIVMENQKNLVSIC
jgi:predicted porin